MLERIKLFMMNHKFLLIIPIVVVFLVMFYLSYFVFEEENEVLVLNEREDEIILVNDVETNVEYISVDIKGHVKNPGVYRLDKKLSRRIVDVITMAGGLLNDADTSVTNMARKVFDEMVIIIFSKDEVKDFVKIEEEIVDKIDGCEQFKCDSCINEDELDNPLKEDEEEISLININEASKDELMKLPGVGESKALAIIEYRSKTKFSKIEDIMNVSGIGESAYSKIKEYITV